MDGDNEQTHNYKMANSDKWYEEKKQSNCTENGHEKPLWTGDI